MMPNHSTTILHALIFTAFLAGCSLGDNQEPIQASLSSEPPRKSTPIPTIELVSTQLPPSLNTLPVVTNTSIQIGDSTKEPIESVEPVGSTSTPAQLAAFKEIPTVAPLSSWDDTICSPMVYVELKDLPRVVSEKYNPPPMGSDARHQGVDFCYYNWKGQGKLEGTPAKAVFSGRVAASEKDSYPYGNFIIVETLASALPEEVRSVFGIDMDESLYVLFAHLGEGSPFFKLGEQVSKCDALGTVGHTGNAGSSHLHLEMRVGLSGRIFDGLSAFREIDTPKEKQNYQIWRSSGDFLHFDPLRLLLFEYSHGATATPTPEKNP
jgi:murein DD-endopeptidase MepM/ murein hydrolase activator NlpD